MDVFQEVMIRANSTQRIRQIMRFRIRAEFAAGILRALIFFDYRIKYTLFIIKYQPIKIKLIKKLMREKSCAFLFCCSFLFPGFMR